MKLEIAEIIHHVGRQQTVSFDQPCPLEAGLDCTAPVHATLRLTNTGRYLLVQGSLTTTVRVDCSRCLKETLLPLEACVEEEFALPVVDEQGVAHWEVEEGSDLPILYDYLLDVDELARQLLSLAVPTAPLCRADCHGLCPHCGKDLNEGPCSCPPEPADPRLAILQTLWKERN